jgi:hypothetical protein
LTGTNALAYSSAASVTEEKCFITLAPQFSKRIIGGEKAKFAELPWQVRITFSILYWVGGNQPI